MKILIIGKNSYIGNHIDEWLKAYGHEVYQLDVLSPKWKTYNYSSFDVIIHVAGIVHQPNCKDWGLYKSVNCDMPIAIANMAKAQGVKGYIFFSTMGVYDARKSLKGSIIDEHTPTIKEGNSMYGKSKLMAEEGLKDLQDVNFFMAIVRPPSVYGKDCRGGYITGFKSIATKLPLIPKAFNDAKQSFIYIDNLSECVRLILENKLSGTFCPQDEEIPNANRLLEVICNSIGKKYRESYLLGSILKVFSFVPLVNKAYGGIAYSPELSKIPGKNYVVVSLQEGMKRTLGSK